MGWSITHGAVRPSQRSPAMKVWVAAAQATRTCSGAISGLILKTISSGPPTLRRRAASSAHSCGRYELASRMLFTKVDSWFMGINTNVPGKQKGTFLLYSGGAQLTARNATR